MTLKEKRLSIIRGPALPPKRGSKWSRWQSPVQKKYLLGCCDCGLYHWMDFRVDNEGMVQYRISRAPHITKVARRSKQYAKR